MQREQDRQRRYAERQREREQQQKYDADRKKAADKVIHPDHPVIVMQGIPVQAPVAQGDPLHCERG